MFGSSKKNTKVPSVFSADLKLNGNIFSEGTLEIAANIEGNIVCTNLSLHKDGVVRGDIQAESVYISGQIYGTVKAKNIKLSADAMVHGMIMYENLIVEEGAFVDGTLNKVIMSDIVDGKSNYVEYNDCKMIEDVSDQSSNSLNIEEQKKEVQKTKTVRKRAS